MGVLAYQAFLELPLEQGLLGAELAQLGLPVLLRLLTLLRL
jgi:hypothetical protein